MTLSRTLDSHCCRLRRKLATAGAAPLVHNIWGTGYRLADPAILD
jgi:DNA-binding response OmpR family regulator